MSFALRGSLYGTTTEQEREASKNQGRRVTILNKRKGAKFGKHGKNGRRVRLIGN
jgi:hypothetical protein